jgi:UDP-N-acetyl-D-glucosamine/UDP-N-acetyl-D-galactosamine dehydrogenase
MKTIAVVGLGYVGLPLALQFGKHFRTIGYDINESKINAYKNYVDPADEVTYQDFEAAYPNFEPTTDIAKISEADFVIVAMPTPVDENKRPDFVPLKLATEAISGYIKEGATVIYESTVNPGATEEHCIPILERGSGMKWKQGFFIGYSPERISPGDKVMPLTKLKKIVSGDTEATLGNVAELYETIIEAGVYRAPSIAVAEAAKLVENIQRDVNIALMNELAYILREFGLDTNEVLDAAASKWNFSNYRPGLVGGHCIGVDPYYLIHPAKTKYHANLPIIEGARVVNEYAPYFVWNELLFKLGYREKLRVAILGLTFKENCRDVRNSKSFELYKMFDDVAHETYACDPVADAEDVKNEYGVAMTKLEDIPPCDIVILAAPHTEWLASEDVYKIINLTKPDGIFADIKGRIDRSLFKDAPFQVWRM